MAHRETENPISQKNKQKKLLCTLAIYLLTYTFTLNVRWYTWEKSYYRIVGLQ